MTPGNMEALQSSEVSFWSVDLPLISPEAHTTCNEVEISASLRVSQLLLCFNSIFNLLPCYAVRAWDSKGERLFGLRRSFGWGDFPFWGGLFGVF